MQDLKTIGNFINQLKGLYSQLVQSVASSSVAASLNPDKRKWFVIHMLLAVKKKNSTLAQAMGDQEILAQVLETTDSENIHTRVDEKLLEELATILTEPLIAHWREEFRDHQVGFKKAFNELYERLFRWLCMRDVPIAMLGEEPFFGSSIGEESGGRPVSGIRHMATHFAGINPANTPLVSSSMACGTGFLSWGWKSSFGLCFQLFAGFAALLSEAFSAFCRAM